MTSSNPVYERWYQQSRPAYGLTPGVNGGYSENSAADWLTRPVDDLFIELRDKVDDLGRQLNPLTCDAIWLDYIAGFCGFTGPYWDKNWAVQAKRTLLSNCFSLIWPLKGTSRALSFVLNAFDIKHIIQEGTSFIIGVDEVGDELGVVAWDYTILLPNDYYKTEKETLARRLDSLFGPCWCTKKIIFSNEFFRTFEVLGFTANDQFTLFSPNPAAGEAFQL
ncbi:phage tail protein [Nodosilinea sp. LEGE 07298]|uniref:phage tail protein n=1 Tax=Nodosilinea sp. LEGE 07298 TaxID=2777970 RepID=UPI00187FD299|nr:phage tail protein [Nodosilinea sp. LEGE 07298]